ncbi:hypothetical protein BO78DRAFT_423109 [Aspergillus sclerotiicarbonarius CBS 121057]|uniref:Uncharacterized protein n=1 Tax=Aspergillus sclerotiicarbonarius (strain CBS 121057 / IBT 28362) TaxID=1448318 RepID=A0A319DVW8_ASPSB|nr:hypothetical protein BO78DRAFT_423109 [Aspergillus sclerotiicarbonarius CBS 121057]
MDQLPTEILWSIDQHFDRSETRWALSQCSRRLHVLFGPLVFSSLVGWHPHPGLVKHLWRHPDLASSVQNVEFEFYACQCDPLDESNEDEEYEGGDLIEKMVNEVCSWPMLRLEWKCHLVKKCPDAWLAVLLSCLTCLHSITLNPHGVAQFVPEPFQVVPSFDQRKAFIEWTLPDPPAGTQAFCFPFLQTIKVNGEDEGLGPSSRFATSLLFFPAIRRIQYHGLWGFGRELIAVMDSLESRGMQDGASLGKLTHFQVEIGNRMDLDWQMYLFRPGAFRHLLLPSKDTLQILSLDFDRLHRYRVNCCGIDRYLPRDTITDNHPFGSLKDFHVLKELKMRHANLVGLPYFKWRRDSDVHVDLHGDLNGYPRQCLIDILPSSLASLTITEISWTFLQALISDVEALLNAKAKEMPCLEHITLHVYTERRHFRMVTVFLDSLGLVAQGMGVRMVYELQELEF